MIVLTGPPTGEKHRRLGGWRLVELSPPGLSPCPRLRVAGLLALVRGLSKSSLGLGESLLFARNAAGEEVPSTCNGKQSVKIEDSDKNE